MNRLFGLALLIVFVIFGAALQTQPAEAFADASSYTLNCNRFSASGTTDAPYVTLYVYDGVSVYFTVIASSGGTYAGSVSFPPFAEGTELNIEVWGSLAPWTDFSDPDYWDGDSYFEANATCSGLSTNQFVGPPIPAGYVLRTITCDTAVYDTPAGSPVGSAAVRTGQTFYVNPTPETAANGTSWTRIFVSSSPNPYIPTSCVN